MKKRELYLFILLLALVNFRLWFGVYRHDEFPENYLFIKHRPVWKWYFYSPTGMSDMTLKDLSPDRRKEQLLFDEFIKEKGLSR